MNLELYALRVQGMSSLRSFVVCFCEEENVPRFVGHHCSTRHEESWSCREGLWVSMMMRISVLNVVCSSAFRWKRKGGSPGRSRDLHLTI
jgi:hypothetical protein